MFCNIMKHRASRCGMQVYFPIPTKIDTIMNELAAHKTLIDNQQKMIDDLRLDLNSRGEPQRKKPGNS
uniref:Uncharacterized protein n=1 Tax=Ditylenchus dipsaci TaxID=166011 RepID=A0A915D7I4_9BILA